MLLIFQCILLYSFYMLHFDRGEILQEFVFNCVCRAMSVTSSESSQEDSLHEDDEEHEKEEQQLDEEQLEEEEELEEDDELEEQEHLDEESVTEQSIEQLVETTDVGMQRELSIVAVPPKVVLQEENQLEVSSSPAFHILDAVSMFSL